MCLCRRVKSWGHIGVLPGGGFALLEPLLLSPWRLQELSEDLSRETEAELHCLTLSLALVLILCLQGYRVGTSWHPSMYQFAFRSLGQYASRLQTVSCYPHDGLRGQSL